MIVLNIECAAGHRFEGWFASVEAFDDQAQRQLVLCPHCNSASVFRRPSGPRVVRHAAVPAPMTDPEVAQVIHALRNLADVSEDVGGRFPEEARRIHYREAPERQIRGVASIKETLDLIDEGVAVLPLPVPPKSDLH